MTDKAPIALGPPPTSEGEPEADKQAIPLAAPEEVGGGTTEQEGVVSVVVTEQESDDVGRGSAEKLVKGDDN